MRTHYHLWRHRAGGRILDLVRMRDLSHSDALVERARLVSDGERVSIRACPTGGCPFAA